MFIILDLQELLHIIGNMSNIERRKEKREKWVMREDIIFYFLIGKRNKVS